MYYTVIRYSDMHYRGFFRVNGEPLPEVGQKCLVRSPRGLEIGTVLCGCLTHDGEVRFVKNNRGAGGSGAKGVLDLLGEVVRVATEEDMEKMESLRRRGSKEETAFCRERIREHGLEMKLAGVEYLFEGEKIIFYFLAEGRVDFRALVRDLAKKYRTRIEMKQIGVRDEARLLAEYEHCGLRLCCKSFLNNLEPVTMRMAKCQKTTLDPSKISGRCGRLMCCLRYEDNVYRELKESLPRKGATVALEGGRARVISQDVLLQKLVVESESGERQIIHLKDVLEILPPSRDGEGRQKAGGGDQKPKRSQGRPGPRGRGRKPRRPQKGPRPSRPQASAEPRRSPREGGGGRKDSSPPVR